MSAPADRKSTRLNSSHLGISYAVFCLKKKKRKNTESSGPRKNHVRHLRSTIIFPSWVTNSPAGISVCSSCLSHARCKRKCFFFKETATTEISTLSLHDALPI